MEEYKDECTFCIHLRYNGTCGCVSGIMYGVQTNGRVAQLCKDRRYYTREASKQYKKKRKIESIYDYE